MGSIWKAYVADEVARGKLTDQDAIKARNADRKPATREKHACVNDSTEKFSKVTQKDAEDQKDRIMHSMTNFDVWVCVPDAGAERDPRACMQSFVTSVHYHALQLRRVHIQDLVVRWGRYSAYRLLSATGCRWMSLSSTRGSRHCVP